MVSIVPLDPQSAIDYYDFITGVVLLEIGQILGSFRGKFAVIGGAVAWLLLGNERARHIGTLNVDLSLDRMVGTRICDT